MTLTEAQLWRTIHTTNAKGKTSEVRLKGYFKFKKPMRKFEQPTNFISPILQKVAMKLGARIITKRRHPARQNVATCIALVW